MTDSRASDHSREVSLALAIEVVPSPVAPVGRPRPTPSLSEVYEEHFDFVWRTTRRLGVDDLFVDDVVQEVFLVVHRRLEGFEGRSSLRTWLYGITRRVVADHRKSQRRRRHDPLPEALRAEGTCPAESAERREATRLLHEVLDSLDDEKREAFVLAELEQMSAPEIAEAIGVNLNTVYSRVRAARRAFEGALARIRARERWGMR